MRFSALTPTICALGETPASSCASPSLFSTTIFLVCAESAQAQIASNEAKRRMRAFLLWEMRILSHVHRVVRYAVDIQTWRHSPARKATTRATAVVRRDVSGFGNWL